MFTRMEDKNVTFSSDTGFFKNKIILFQKERCRFENFMDYEKFFELAYLLTNRLHMPENLRNYFVEFLRLVVSCKILYIENFDENSTYNVQEYNKKIQSILDGINLISVDSDGLEILSLQEVSKDELCKSVKENDSSEYNIVSNYTENELLIARVVFTEKYYQKYSNTVVCMVEKITGYFETDLFLSLLSLFHDTNLNKNTVSLTKITTQGVHVDIACAINIALGSLVYLKNSTSVKENTLEFFDEFELKNRLENVKLVLQNAITKEHK